MGLDENVEKMQQRQHYKNLWHTDLMGTITADTGYCCFACFCGYCASYMLRKRALYDDMTSGKCGESKCPEFCLVTEVCCCFGTSVSSTRYLLQDEFNIQTTPCDNCIIGFMIILKQVACIFSILACITGSEEIRDIADVLGCIAEIVYCSVCACIQTQHKVEMDKRDNKLDPQPAMGVPLTQHMSRK